MIKDPNHNTNVSLQYLVIANIHKLKMVRSSGPIMLKIH